MTIRILLGLILGLGLGAGLAAVNAGALPTLQSIAQPVGSLWLDSLRMTIVPLVFALIVVGITSASDAAAAGGLARRALLLFALLLLMAGLISALLTPALLRLWPIPEGAGEALARGLRGSAPVDTAVPPPGEWLKQIIPANPIKAAADGAMLPLVIFALAFGFALTRIEENLRRSLSRAFQAIVDTLLVIIHWVLLLAPIGVLALAFQVGSQAGLGAAGALAQYVLIICLVCTVVIAAIYLGVALSGRMGLGAFARAAAPAQVVAFSTQSSLASLPAMVEGTRGHLKVPPATSGLVLPLAVSLFRITSPAANLAVAIYLAHLYGVQVTPLQVGAALLTAAVVSLASVGLPSQVSFFAVVAPVCLTLGVPTEILGLLLAVESIPDIFRTVGNVTADVAVTGLLADAEGDRPPAG